MMPAAMRVTDFNYLCYGVILGPASGPKGRHTCPGLWRVLLPRAN